MSEHFIFCVSIPSRENTQALIKRKPFQTGGTKIVLPEPAPLPASAPRPQHRLVAQSPSVTPKMGWWVNPGKQCRAALCLDGCPCPQPVTLLKPPQYLAAPSLIQQDKKSRDKGDFSN